MAVPILSDLGKLAEPLTVFIKRVSRGIGTLYEPKRIVRKATAEAKAMLIHAEADAEVRAIAERAKDRAEFIQNRQQANLESIIRLALPLVQQDPNHEDFDEDWLIQFMNHAEDVGDSEMQKIWAKVLSGEYNAKGSFSNRALHTIKLLRKADAELITRFCSFVSILNHDLYAAIHIRPNRLQAFGVTDMTVGQLKDLGIITETMHYILPNKEARHRLDYFDKAVIFFKGDRVQFEPTVVFYVVSEIGKELFHVAAPVANMEYFAALRASFDLDGIEVIEAK
jgi:hypothetical protein